MRRFASIRGVLLFGVATGLFVVAPPLRAQTAATLTFDTVSIKRNYSSGGPTMIISPFDSDHILIANASLRPIIGEAFDIPLHELIIGLPNWTESEAYDIEAKVGASDSAAFRKLLPRQRSPMLQSVLAERFHLVSHFETRTVSAYALVVAKGGAKLKQVEPTLLANGLKNPGGIDTTPNQFIATGATMEPLLHALQRQLDRLVVDRTGIAGNYNFTLNFAPVQTSTSSVSGPESDAIGPSLFTALQEQLGLRLEPVKAPAPVLVIDHIERPTEN